MRPRVRTQPSPSIVPLRAAPPWWVRELAAAEPTRFCVLTASIPQATALSACALAAAVTASYRDLGAQMIARGAHAIRIWNFVPEIQAPLGDGDRYMAFNLGRFNAYTEWFGGSEQFGCSLPTASGVGITGDTLSIHVLAATVVGAPVENPRQIPAYRYSSRYGIRPPCFARATRFDDMLLIGGTASILGEDSQHTGDIHCQTRETLANIAALIGAAAPGRSRELDTLTDLRVHVLRAADAAAVQAILDELAPGVRDVEFVEAALCRPELLVEIEGRARL